MNGKSILQLRLKTMGMPSAEPPYFGDTKANVWHCLLQATLELLGFPAKPEIAGDDLSANFGRAAVQRLLVF